MANKNSADFSLDKLAGNLSLVTSATQKTTNFQATDNYATGTIFSQTASATIANSVAEITLVGTGVGSTTLPANFLLAGKTIMVMMYGTIASILTPTLRVKVKLGSTVIIDTTAATLATITGTNLFTTSGMIACRTTGATGTVFGQGMQLYYTGVTGLAGIASPNTTTSTIDTTTSQVLDVTVQWGTASASNTITSTNLSVFVMN